MAKVLLILHLLSVAVLGVLDVLKPRPSPTFMLRREKKRNASNVQSLSRHKLDTLSFPLEQRGSLTLKEMGTIMGGMGSPREAMTSLHALSGKMQKLQSWKRYWPKALKPRRLDPLRQLEGATIPRASIVTMPRKLRSLTNSFPVWRPSTRSSGRRFIPAQVTSMPEYWQLKKNDNRSGLRIELACPLNSVQ